MVFFGFELGKQNIDFKLLSEVKTRKKPLPHIYSSAFDSRLLEAMLMAYSTFVVHSRHRHKADYIHQLSNNCTQMRFDKISFGYAKNE